MKRTIIAVLGATALLTPAITAAQTVQRATFDEVFEWTGTLVLEERDEALNAGPVLEPDPRGGWIVHDRPENQVRLYDKDGRLRHWFGRRGGGPGEFDDISGAVRLPSGAIVTANDDERITVWSEDGSAVLYDFRVPVLNINRMIWLQGDSVLVAAGPRFTEPGRTGDLLHIIDVGERRIVRSMLSLPVSRRHAPAWGSLQMAGLVREREDRIVVALALLDSLLHVSPTGEVQATRPIGIMDPEGPPDGRADRNAFIRWIQTEAILLSGLHGSATTGWTIPLLRGGPDPGLGILYIPTSGPILHVTDAPTVVAFDPATGRFVFADPASLEPNRFRFARLRR